MATSNRLRDAAQQHASNGGHTLDGVVDAASLPAPTGPAPSAGAELEPIDYDGNAIADAEKVPVQVAWARVMADVQSIRKSETATVQTSKSSYKYRFRGVDQVFNAAGPALRRHGVMVLQTKVEATYARASSSGGSAMRECTVTVTYSIIGPLGDSIPVQSVGEGLDTSDKATTKALTMAYRTLLVNGLTVPTDDPKIDADNSHLERGEARFDPAAYRDEALDPRTSTGRLKQMLNDLRRLGRGAELVENEVGDEEKLGNLLLRLGRERQRPADSSGDEEWPATPTPPDAP
jgi:hypothetical protein